ncbi:LacI family DNA-binding transcriptional regulator [Methylocapsa sp. S129]|uniref:LacI family DNA-binding transcriptional regulator n=1 Tax=Methylocapsa sp. S129 TaxID=1641869 RepID=UPI00131DA471|nr:LacI family DNA-binding transcriptional regulator [Methylocapsa sp. S129]
MKTLKDVALRAGVSIASVSTVINNTAAVSPAMRKKVERAVADLGYIPHALARNLKMGRVNVIGLILPDIANPHFSELASAIEVACDSAGFSLMLCNTSDNAEKEVRHLRMMRAQRVAGVIFVPGGSPTHDTEALGRLLEGPAVLLDRAFASLALDCVLLDNVEAGRLAADHLVQNGHRRIGIVAGPPHLQISQDRVAGCRAAMRAHGLPFEESLVVDGGFRPELAYHATRAVLRRRARPTAVIATSNHTTVGVMKALAELGLRCPADVSVAAIDDFTWAEGFAPRLTAVAQPIEAMGQEAVRRLLARSDSRASPQCVVLPPRLIIRDSTRVLE